MRRTVIFGLVVLIAAAVLIAVAALDGDSDLAARRAKRTHRTPARLVTMHRRIRLGRSVQGRPITAIEIGNPSSPNSILAVGCIHGNECAGLAITRVLEHMTPRRSVNLWIVPDLNPDGRAAHTRQDARGVDLNRNFPYRWRQSGLPGDLTYSGSHPLSVPESRIAWSLIRRVRPTISVWFHQPLGLVDESGGSIAIERRYARLIDLPLKRLLRYHGSATGWQNHNLPTTTAFVVELPAGRLPHAEAHEYAHALITLP